MGLTEFDLAPTEIKNHSKVIEIFSKSADTKSISKVERISDEYEYEKKKEIIKRFGSYESNHSNDQMETDEDSHFLHSSFSPYSSSMMVSNFIKESNRENTSISSKTNTDISNLLFDDDASVFMDAKAYCKQRPSAAVADKNNLLNAEYINKFFLFFCKFITNSMLFLLTVLNIVENYRNIALLIQYWVKYT